VRDLMRSTRFDLPAWARLTGLKLGYLKQLSSGHKGAGAQTRRKLADALRAHARVLERAAAEMEKDADAVRETEPAPPPSAPPAPPASRPPTGAVGVGAQCKDCGAFLRHETHEPDCPSGGRLQSPPASRPFTQPFPKEKQLGKKPGGKGKKQRDSGGDGE
jgi:hypothetical protein